MTRRTEQLQSATTPLARKAGGVGLAVAAVAVAAWAMTGQTDAAPAAVVAKAAPPAFTLHKSSWGDAPRTEPTAPASDAGFTPANPQDDEKKKQRAEQARELWQNLDIAVSTER
jgi:hypothetical protein